MQHALDCKVSGLLRHNEIRDCAGDIAAQVVRDADIKVGDSELWLDLGVCGVWYPLQ